jgi:hypothetical protein
MKKTLNIIIAIGFGLFGLLVFMMGLFNSATPGVVVGAISLLIAWFGYRRAIGSDKPKIQPKPATTSSPKRPQPTPSNRFQDLTVGLMASLPITESTAKEEDRLSAQAIIDMLKYSDRARTSWRLADDKKTLNGEGRVYYEHYTCSIRRVGQNKYVYSESSTLNIEDY